jgi:hypothetical protein
MIACEKSPISKNSGFFSGLFQGFFRAFSGMQHTASSPATASGFLAKMKHAICLIQNGKTVSSTTDLVEKIL